MGASTPHFALQIRNRIRNLICPLPPDHPARVEGEREIERLDEIALAARHGPDSGSANTDCRELPRAGLNEHYSKAQKLT